MKTRSSPGARSGGFTLFEVMAAVLVLGLLYTVLADITMQGLRSEGTNRRRGEASLLADRRLSELEARLAAGQPLVPGHTEEELPPYRVSLDVAPVDLLSLVPPDPDAEPAARGEKVESILDVSPSGESRIHEATLTVEWEEVGEPYRVIRRTFDFDTSGLDDLLPGSGGDTDGAEVAPPAIPDLPFPLPR